MGTIAGLLVLFVLALVAGPQDGSDVRTTSSIGNALNLSLAGLCWIVVIRARVHRAPLVLGASAVSAFALADLYFVLALDGSAAIGFNVVSDVGYLLFYPLVISALMVLVAPQMRRSHWPVLLDGVVAVSGAAAVMVVVLVPLLAPIADRSSFDALIAGAYVVFDVSVLALLAGMLGCRGAYVGKRWPFLVAGLLLFSLTDVLYALELTDYVLGTPMDVGWALGMALVTVWLDDAATARTPPVDGASALVAPLVATAAALGVLILGTRNEVPVPAVMLAACTLALSAMPLIFRHRLLQSLARTDELTGLRNRRALHTDGPRLVQGSVSGALLLIDLDQFKHVNDGLGHDAGDQLLKQVSGRIGAVLHRTDLFARLGGDEFAVVLPGIDRDAALGTVARLRSAFDTPFLMGNASLAISASFGVSLFPLHGTELGVLLRRADIAMFRAKAEHSGFHVYGSEDHDDGAARLRRLAQFRTALSGNELVLHYQPKVDPTTSAVTGVEALVRWNHPVHGLLLPDAFLGLAEEAGLMPQLTEVVLAQAMDQLVRWRDTGTALSVAVNFSTTCIDDELPQRIEGMLAGRDLEPSSLVLEITEQMLMKDGARTAEVLHQLRAKGVRVSIDDFGSGYSSLAYLRDLPVDELKLDRAFLIHVHQDQRAASLVSSIITLAHGLGLEVVAEGVKTPEDYSVLAGQGCDVVQGYHILPPVPASELAAWLTSRRALLAAG
ncbi:bifunctional diguanylate cyclase/phosphodiesterase [Arthrobacter echini]|nr:EAL domain-containing protein [Arthrobacter echini]